MPIFIVENQELKDNMYDIPKDLERHLQDTLNKYQEYGTTAAGTMSKGFKRLQSLVDPDYNKQGENTSNDGSRRISFGDMKRIDHDLRHMSQDPHDLQRILNGGDKMAQFVQDTLRKERTKVEPVLQQKKVETRNKNKVNPPKSPMKPIEVGDITANVHEAHNRKTVFISESQLKTLMEYRDELELPFHDLGPMSTPYAKPNYRHFLDWLENMGKYGSLPSSTSNINDLIDQYEPSSFDLWVDRTYDLDPDIINEWAKDWVDINQPYLNELSVLSPNEIAAYLDKDYTDDIVLHQLNDIGEESWANFLRERFYDELDVYRFPHDLSVNERGLIYVERTIEIPKLTSYTYSTYVRGKQSDLYKHLTNEYGNGVGRYWSWQPNGSAIYNSSEYGGTDKPVCIILKGWVDPTSVDWVETLIVNAYSLKEEKEINIRGGQPVELFEIEFPNKKLQLKQPLIIYT